MLSYKRQIVLPLVIASITLGAALAALFFAAYHLIEVNAFDDKIENVRYEILALQNAIIKAETGQRGYLLTNNIGFVETYQSGRNDIAASFSKLSVMLKPFPELKPMFEKVEYLVNIKLRSMEASIQTQMSSGAYSPHLSSARIGANVMMQIDRQLRHADALLVNKKTYSHFQVQRALRQTVWIAMALVVVIFALLFTGYRRTIKLFEIAVDSKSVAEEYSHDAYHDMLTKLPNRRYFETHLKRMIALSKRNHQPFALFYLDLDGFKAINDQYGHDAGDEALIYAANRFKAALRESDFLARLGGDEFAVIIEQYYNHKELSGLANRIIRYLQQPFSVQGYPCKLGVSIGIGTFPEDGKEMEGIIKAADKAMFKAKRSGKNKAIFASASLHPLDY